MINKFFHDKQFNILQIGVGSMGKRRVRNLQHLGITNITCFDIRPDRMEEAVEKYGISFVDNLDLVDWKSITHVIISTPPDMHVKYGLIAAQKGKHFFMEASVVDDGYDDLLNEIEGKDFVAAPSCTMRFDPIISKAKEFIDSGIIGRPLFATHYFGQNLHKWHPYEHIKDFYVSNPKTGACREIVPFDLVYLTWLLGNPINMTALISNTKALGEDIEIDDIYSLMFKTDMKVQIQLTIDVLSQASYRDTRIICEKGNIEIDNINGTLKLYKEESKTWQLFNRSQDSITFSSEEMYVREMNCFIDSTIGVGKFPFDLSDDHKVLKMLFKSEEAYRTNKILF